jgi:hypothetical protein
VPAPFYLAIKGTTAGAPGTGAFTPNAASSGFRAWSTVPAGWIGMVRYEDGSDWSLEWSYWDGTTLSRASTQHYDSSTGSHLSLTSAATAALIVDAGEVMSNLGGVPWKTWGPTASAATLSSGNGMATGTVTGTGSAGTALAATNYLTQQPRIQITSATTANAQAGVSTTVVSAVVSTASGRGGIELTWRFGASQLPTGPRFFMGLTAGTFVGNTGEPSAFTQNYAVLGKDSSDTNLQFLTNSNAGAGTKIDTGIAVVANGWYEASIWCEPGSNTMHLLLIRLDTGAIFYTTTSTDVPATGALVFPQFMAGLSATTGTAMIFHFGNSMLRIGS